MNEVFVYLVIVPNVELVVERPRDDQPDEVGHEERKKQKLDTRGWSRFTSGQSPVGLKIKKRSLVKETQPAKNLYSS